MCTVLLPPDDNPIAVNKYIIWSMALYGAETWTLRAADQKYLDSFEMCGAGEGWRRSVGPIM